MPRVEQSYQWNPRITVSPSLPFDANFAGGNQNVSCAPASITLTPKGGGLPTGPARVTALYLSLFAALSLQFTGANGGNPAPDSVMVYVEVRAASNLIFADTVPLRGFQSGSRPNFPVLGTTEFISCFYYTAYTSLLQAVDLDSIAAQEVSMSAIVTTLSPVPLIPSTAAYTNYSAGSESLYLADPSESPEPALIAVTPNLPVTPSLVLFGSY